MMVKEELRKLGINYVSLDLGMVEILEERRLSMDWLSARAGCMVRRVAALIVAMMMLSFRVGYFFGVSSNCRDAADFILLIFHD